MKHFLSVIALLVVAGPALAFGSLVSQQVNGSLRYCKYSNGVIVTINSYELCPVTVN